MHALCFACSLERADTEVSVGLNSKDSPISLALQPSPLFFPHYDCLLLLLFSFSLPFPFPFFLYVAHVIGMGGCSYLADSMCTTGFGVFSIQISHPPGLTLIDIIAAAACPISQNQFWATLVSGHIGWRQSCYDVINAELMDSIYD